MRQLGRKKDTQGRKGPPDAPGEAVGRLATGSPRGRNRRARRGVVLHDGRGGEDPRAPTTAAEISVTTGARHIIARRSFSRAPVRRYATPARSRASVPARSEASRSSSVNPAGASVSVVTPAAA
ncbi:hypothetical protein GCM10010349_60540 [Streptomyces flavofungini]|nr:hypothetical protein GCM10010349_60540 [Streptomyces flavofungini]